MSKQSWKKTKTNNAIRNRVVDVIGRSKEWLKSNPGKKYPYTISFTATEPYIIVRVYGTKAVEAESGFPRLYYYYRVDGGKMEKMDVDRWANLHKDLFEEPEPETAEFPPE